MKEIPVVFSSNEAFIPYTSAMLQSIMEHSNVEKEYMIFLLHGKLNDSTKQKLQQQISKYQNIKISFINVSEYFDKFNFYNIPWLSRETYFRLIIPWIFSQYEKVIYLDCDMIANVDIAEILDIDMGDNCLMASREACTLTKKRYNYYNYYNNCFGLKKPENYFNAGFLVFNIKKFQELISMQDLLEFAASRKWGSQDQDVLNVLCEEKTLLLDSSWNFLAGHYSQERLDSLFEPYRSDFINAKENPKIIHFTNGEFYKGKPDKTFFYILYAEYFWKYATRTPFLSDIIIGMQKKCLINISIFKMYFYILDKCGLNMKKYFKSIFPYFVKKIFWKFRKKFTKRPNSTITKPFT